MLVSRHQMYPAKSDRAFDVVMARIPKNPDHKIGPLDLKQRFRAMQLGRSNRRDASSAEPPEQPLLRLMESRRRRDPVNREVVFKAGQRIISLLREGRAASLQGDETRLKHVAERLRAMGGNPDLMAAYVSRQKGADLYETVVSILSKHIELEETTIRDYLKPHKVRLREIIDECVFGTGAPPRFSADEKKCMRASAVAREYRLSLEAQLRIFKCCPFLFTGRKTLELVLIKGTLEHLFLPPDCS